MKKFLFVSSIFLLTLCVSGTEYFVDFQHGRKNNPGTEKQPFPDFHTALAKLKAGDTLHILPSAKPIRCSLRTGFLKGTREKPVIIDGMNNIFEGSAPLDMKHWQEVKPGLFCRKRQNNSGMMIRYYMIHKGAAVFMGRTSKGSSRKWKKPDELAPGEWTVVDTAPRSRGQHLFECYVRLAEGEKTPADGSWEEPSFVSGVAISAFCTPESCGHPKCGKECSHIHSEYIIFRNIIVRHFWNDGFNIHGKVRNIRFENIAAVECGDDGLSAHGNTQIAAKNFVSVRNSTGISHTQQAECVHENCYIEGSRGIDFYPCKETRNVLEEIYVQGDSPRGVILDVRTGGSVTMKNCIFVNQHPKAIFGYAQKDSVKGTFENVQTAGYRKCCQEPGLKKGEDLSELLQKKKAELFGLFGGNLEKAVQ